MSDTKKTMGPVLRHLREGPAEIQTRVPDFNVTTVKGPDGKEMDVPATTLIAFTAISFREIERDSDLWEFVTYTTVNGQSARAMLYLHGEDIFMVRAMSRVA